VSTGSAPREELDARVKNPRRRCEYQFGQFLQLREVSSSMIMRDEVKEGYCLEHTKLIVLTIRCKCNVLFLFSDGEPN
jgi:hypothetical protein